MKHTDIDPGDVNHPCWTSPFGTARADENDDADDHPAHTPAAPEADTCNAPSARDRYFLAAVRQRLVPTPPAASKAQA